jgi:hypothetical protein
LLEIAGESFEEWRGKESKFKVKNWGEEKMNWRAVAGTYMVVLPMDSPTDIKLIIILIYSIGEVSKIHR